MSSKKAKRTLPSTGILSPNYSSDPQYGNVSTLPDGQKRIHIYFRNIPKEKDFYYRLNILIPECEVPIIDPNNIDHIDEMNVPVIRNFRVELTEKSDIEKLNKAAHIGVGLFEKDALSLGPFNALAEFGAGQHLDLKNHEAVFILNEPICYYFFEGSDGRHGSNNIPNDSRGWICLQNHINLFVSVHDVDKNKYVSFNAYIDYTWCKMKYRDALIWKADFERNVPYQMKYRLYHQEPETLIQSRGELTFGESNDPSKFPPFVNNQKHFKIPERSLAGALSPKEVLWGKALEKYMK